MRIGLVSPYRWDVPGGVQYHVRDLAETLRGMGHHVEVLTPAEREESLPAEFTTWAGRTVPVPYNGSMASLQLGPVAAARVHRWLRDGHFDVVHVHEPASPSVSFLVCMVARGPIVATFHAATTRSKWLAGLGPWARPWLERISGRIAVSITPDRATAVLIRSALPTMTTMSSAKPAKACSAGTVPASL